MQNICLATCFMPLQGVIKDFWENLHTHLQAQGNTLVLLTTDDPQRIHIPAIQIPFLFADFKNKYGIITPENFEPLGEMEFALIDRDRNWNGWQFHSVMDTVLGYYTARNILKGIVTRLNPGMIWVWGSTLPQSLLLYHIAIEKGIPVQVIERGLLPGSYMLEARGNSGWSGLVGKSLPVHYPFDQALFNRIKHYMIHQQQSKYIQNEVWPEELEKFVQSGNQKTIAFFGDFDMASGTYPRFFKQSFATSPLFASTEQAFRQLMDLVAQHQEWKLIFKPHPNDPGSYNVHGNSNVKIIHNIVPYHLFSVADVLVFLGSTLQFEALFYEKPIVLMGRSQLWGKQIAYEVTNTQELAEQMHNALQKRHFNKFLKNYPLYINYLAKEFLYFQEDSLKVPRTIHHLSEVLNAEMIPLPEDRPPAARIEEVKRWIQTLPKQQNPENHFIRKIKEIFIIALKKFNHAVSKQQNEDIQVSWNRFYQEASREFGQPLQTVKTLSQPNDLSVIQTLNPPVVVAGMHRSGASMLMQMFHTVGVYLGKSEVSLSSVTEKPHGYWENLSFVTINDFILNMSGGSWVDPVEVNVQQLKQHPQWKGIYNETITLLQEFQNHPRWGWKDPRNSLTLPFWKTFLKDFKLIIPFRHPLAVAKSLQKRNHLPLDKGVKLWWYYNQALLRYSDTNSLWIPYEALLSKPQEVFPVILEWLQWEVAEETLQNALRVIKPSLNHYQGKDQEIQLPDEIKQLYDQLWERTPFNTNAPALIPGYLPEENRQVPIENQLETIAHTLEAGNVQRALQELNNLTSRISNTSSYWNAIGVLYYQAGDVPRALQAFQNAYRNSPQDLAVIKNLADLLFQLDEVEAMVKLYSQVININPDDEDALIIAGKLAYFMGETPIARKIFNYVIQKNPQNSVARENLEILARQPIPDNVRTFSDSVTDFILQLLNYVEAHVQEKQQPLDQEESQSVSTNNNDELNSNSGREDLVQETTEEATNPTWRGCPNCGSHAHRKVRYKAEIVTCLDCGLTYLRTLPDSTKLKQVYDQYADEFSHMRLPQDEEEIEKTPLKREYFLDEIEEFLDEPGRMLDVGCGWGAHLWAARKRGFTPQGIEITPKAAEFARKTLNIPVDTRPLEQQHFEQNSFKLVTMNHLLEHLPETRETLDTIFRILEPGGIFAGMVPNFASFCSEMEGENWEWLDPNFHFVHFTPDILRKVLEASGFVVERLYTTKGDYTIERLQYCLLQKYGELPETKIKEIQDQLEKEGRGEEIRFIARKPVDLSIDRKRRQPDHLEADHYEAEPVAETLANVKLNKLKDGTPHFSIIIPVFNQVQYTRVCVEKIYHHTHPEIDFEVIVVDNASTDETPEFLQAAAQRYPNLRYVRSEVNLKYAGGCNLGAQHARGKYLVFLNNDTEPEPGWLMNAWKTFQEEKNVGILGAKLLYPDRTVQHCGIEFQNLKYANKFIWPMHRYRYAKETNPLVNKREDVQAVTGACLFIPRNLFKKVEGFDEAYGMYFEDTDLCFKVRSIGKRVVYEPSVVVIHHEGKTVNHIQKVHRLNEKASDRLFQKWEDDLVDIALDVLLERKDGKYYYFSEDFYPKEVNRKSLTFLAKMLYRLGNFYAFVGGIGDALLFLSTFYDKINRTTVVCAPNSSAATRILFNRFDKIDKVYFLPYPRDGYWHYALRGIWEQLPNCKGRGVTPVKGYMEEWTPDINIFKTYGVTEHPQWIKQIQPEKIQDFQVVLHPVGSVRGMVGTKRNIIKPREWIKLQKYLIENGITPIVIGIPSDEEFYPLLEGCINRRSFNLQDHLRLIRGADVFIGADSWGKTFAALIGIPTFVFKPPRGKDLVNWEDPSEFVFIRPWKAITLVEGFEEFQHRFSQYLPHPPKPVMDYGQFSLQNGQKPSPYWDIMVKENQLFLVRRAGLGDMIMVLPLIRAIKKAHPDVEVNFITDDKYKHIVDANPDVDRFFPGYVYEKYLIFEENAYNLEESKFGIAETHQVDAYLNYFNLTLPAEEKSIQLNIPSAAVHRVSEILTDIEQEYKRSGAQQWQKMVLLHPAKGDPNRTWPKENWEELARLLIASGNLVITVGSGRYSHNRGVHFLDVPGVIHLEDQLSLIEFVALCEKADILISSDSGPIQLAAATDIAIVGIYSVVRGQNRLPYRHGKLGWQAVAVEPACPHAPCYEKMNDTAFMQVYYKQIIEGKLSPAELFSNWCLHTEKFTCMQHLITVQQVWEAVQPFLFESMDADVILQKVEELVKSSEFVQAQKELEKWIRRDDVDARILKRYVELLKERGEWVQYVEWLEKYVKRNPDDAVAANELGVVRWQQNRKEEALNLFKSAVNLNGNHPDHVKNLADALLSEERFEDAIQLYIYLIHKYPRDPEAYERLATLYIENGNYEDAKLLIDKALEYNPDNAYLKTWRRLLEIPKLFLAYNFINQGELDLARELFEEVLMDHPQNIDALTGLGSILFNKEDYKSAKKLYQQVLKYDPHNVEAIFYIAKILIQQGDARGITQLFQDHHSLFKSHALLRKVYIEWLLHEEQFDAALHALDQFLGDFPDDADGYMILGNLFYEGGRVKEARRFYTRALELAPENEELRQLLENMPEDEEN